MANAKLNELIEEFKKQVPGFISTDIVSLEDGLSVAGGSIDPNFDSSIASAYYATVASAFEKTCNAIDKTLEPDDILISTDKFYILIRLLSDTGYYHGLAAKLDTNVGMCRLLMKKYGDAFIKAL